jgi:hypothetical protein
MRLSYLVWQQYCRVFDLFGWEAAEEWLRNQ